jgi:hypothetical protein
MDNNFASGNMKQSSKAHSRHHVTSQTQVNHAQDSPSKNDEIIAFALTLSHVSFVLPLSSS